VSGSQKYAFKIHWVHVTLNQFDLSKDQERLSGRENTFRRMGLDCVPSPEEEEKI